MKSRFQHAVTVVGIFAFSLIFIGCEGTEGPAGPAGVSLPFVTAEVSVVRHEDGEVYSDGYAIIDNCISIPEVRLNNIPIALNQLDEGGLGFWVYNLPFSFNQQVELNINYRDQNGVDCAAGAQVMIPGEFHIISPDPDETYAIPLGQDLSISWSPAQNCDGYVFYMYLEYDYRDLDDVVQDYFLRLDTLITSTNLVFPATRIFPDVEQVAANVGQM